MFLFFFCVVPRSRWEQDYPIQNVKQQKRNPVRYCFPSVLKPTHSLVPHRHSYSWVKNLKQSWEKVFLLLSYLDLSAYWENIKVYKSFIAQVVPYNSNQASPLFYMGFVSCSIWSYFVTSPTYFYEYRIVVELFTTHYLPSCSMIMCHKLWYHIHTYYSPLFNVTVDVNNLKIIVWNKI